MGRRVKTDIPQAVCHLIPQWHFLPDLQKKDEAFKVKQKRTMTVDTMYEQLTHYLMILHWPVWVTTGNNQTPGRVVSNAATPRSYLVLD